MEIYDRTGHKFSLLIILSLRQSFKYHIYNSLLPTDLTSSLIHLSRLSTSALPLVLSPGASHSTGNPTFQAILSCLGACTISCHHHHPSPHSFAPLYITAKFFPFHSFSTFVWPQVIWKLICLCYTYYWTYSQMGARVIPLTIWTICSDPLAISTLLHQPLLCVVLLYKIP